MLNYLKPFFTQAARVKIYPPPFAGEVPRSGGGGCCKASSMRKTTPSSA